MGHKMITGIDEAGRGPVIGPMVMAGVIIDEENIKHLQDLGVKDSKKIKPEKREELFEKIISVVDDYFIVSLSCEEIDSNLSQEDMNLNWLEADTQAKILERLNPKKAYIDCPSNNPTGFSNYLKQKVNTDCELIVEHSADDKYPVCSAASILAKVTRDREINKLKEEHGDFGSGYPADPKTKTFIRENHQLPIYRKCWSTWKRIEQEKKQKGLKEF